MSRLYNQGVAQPKTFPKTALLARDTTLEAERMQVDAWRTMSPADKAALVGHATRATLDLAMAGIRHRHPAASPRECFLRLATLTLGRTLACSVYPDAAELDVPGA